MSAEKERKSGLASNANSLETQRFKLAGLGQAYQGDCPEVCPTSSGPNDPLGQPLDIRQVAKLLGCSIWMVRQRLLPGGLPHVRFGGAGKLVFYRNQVIDWVLENQRTKGGELK